MSMLCRRSHPAWPQLGQTQRIKRGSTAMKKFVALAILGLALATGTAATVVLDTQAASADSCGGGNC